jgi:hypothetical protein
VDIIIIIMIMWSHFPDKNHASLIALPAVLVNQLTVFVAGVSKGPEPWQGHHQDQAERPRGTRRLIYRAKVASHALKPCARAFMVRGLALWNSSNLAFLWQPPVAELWET